VGSSPTGGTPIEDRSPDDHPGAAHLAYRDHLTASRTTTATARQTTRVHERLNRIQDDLRRVRATERVLSEQVAYLAELAEDAETRKLVAQTPLADRAWREARTDRDRHHVLLDEARREADGLISERDRLLDQLFALQAPAVGRSAS
jgi:Zn-dependent M32 family carboxypeptidase